MFRFKAAGFRAIEIADCAQDAARQFGRRKAGKSGMVYMVSRRGHMEYAITIGIRKRIEWKMQDIEILLTEL